MSVLVLQQLDQHARNQPEAVAYRMAGGERALTYGRLCRSVELLACEVRQVVPAGGVVVVSGENRLELPAAMLAGLSAGVGVLAVSPLLAGEELRDLAKRTGAVACIGTRRVNESLHGVVPCLMGIDRVLEDPGGAGFNVAKIFSVVTPRQADVATPRQGQLLLTSSGTTARPKIVRRDAASLDVVARNCAAAAGMARGEGVLAAIPLTHSYGVEHGLLAPVLAGACVCLSDRFDVANAIDELASGRVSVFPGVPVMFEAISQTDPKEMGFGSSVGPAVRVGPLDGVRCAYWAGGPLTVGILELLKQTWGLRLGQLYGATEIGSVTFRPPSSGLARGLSDEQATNVGRAMEGVKVKILEPSCVEGRVTIGAGEGQPVETGQTGHVAVNAVSMFSGYVDEAGLDRANTYFLTGDLGYLDDNGCLHLTGRIKLLIDVGGRKVNPLEVEGVLAGHPGVAQCAVVGVKASETVYRLKAVVVPKTTGGAGLIDELRDYLRRRLAGYKMPRVIDVVESLPRLPSGKIDRRALGS